MNSWAKKAKKGSSHYLFIRTQVQKGKEDTALNSKDCRTRQPATQAQPGLQGAHNIDHMYQATVGQVHLGTGDPSRLHATASRACLLRSVISLPLLLYERVSSRGAPRTLVQRLLASLYSQSFQRVHRPSRRRMSCAFSCPRTGTCARRPRYRCLPPTE